VLLLIPAVGSVYPVPPAPIKYFPYAYLVYLAVGALRVGSLHKRKPDVSLSIREDLERMHAQFQFGEQ
jgi:threonine/homoserine/homoserine lactone efflux protein